LENLKEVLDKPVVNKQPVSFLDHPNFFPKKIKKKKAAPKPIHAAQWDTQLIVQCNFRYIKQGKAKVEGKVNRQFYLELCRYWRNPFYPIACIPNPKKSK
jgi:hypothetical protein